LIIVDGVWWGEVVVHLEQLIIGCSMGMVDISGWPIDFTRVIGRQGVVGIGADNR